MACKRVGRGAQVYGSGGCASLSRVGGAGSAVWLSVDLEQQKDVGFVKLFMRSDASTSRGDQFEIRLGNAVGELANPVCHSANQNANTATFVNWAQCKGAWAGAGEGAMFEGGLDGSE
jgi:hypothetical protein